MKPVQNFVQERVHFNLAKLKKAGETYEIVVDPDKAILHKEGAKVDIEDVLKAQKIFNDASQGEHASEERLREVFGTDEPLEVAEIILKEGEIQLTAEYRAKVREEKRKRIVQMIAKNTCDPKTKLPHPVLRIENAMEEAKIRINEFKRPEDQLNDIIKDLRPLLPLSMETREMFVHLPALYAAKAHHTLMMMGQIKQNSWTADGSWEGVIDIPAGMMSEFMDKVNSMTHGNATVDIMK